jgi:hypothetical protein
MIDCCVPTGVATRQGLKQGLKPLHDGENKRYPRKTMAQAESEAREQLERILSSPGFVHNERQSQFLRFVVERKLESRDNELKESVIGIEVFGRPPDYNPKRDAIVRTEAGRLRARLAEYYGNGGKRDPVLIELPKGGYVPVIRAAESQPELRITSATRPAASLVKVAIPLLIIFGLGLLWTLRKNASVTAHGWAIKQSTHRSANGYFERGARTTLPRRSPTTMWTCIKRRSLTILHLPLRIQVSPRLTHSLPADRRVIGRIA